MEYFFNKYPEFIEQDDRRDRKVSPIVPGSYSNRHEAALPQELIEGKTILDLGSCIGATGHWCLAHGAKFYMGVEAQAEAVKKSDELLGKYWDGKPYRYHVTQADIDAYLDETIEDDIQYDIVVAFGIIYGHVDYYSLLSKMTKVAKEHIVIDCRYPSLNNFNDNIVEFNDSQHVHVQGEKGLNFVGAGTKLSPEALRFVMRTLGWDNNGQLIYPEPVPNDSTVDMYLTLLNRTNSLNLPTRYLTQFEKSDNVIVSASEQVANNNKDECVQDDRIFTLASDRAPNWEFDDTVAERFQTEAENHIPDYHRVIELSHDIISDVYTRKDVKILDVGSALGYTVDYFIRKGYTETYGVEKSAAMVNRSLHRRHIFRSDMLPLNTSWDAILANWTLHFIEARHEYLGSIYDSLNPGGVLIVTDKMEHTDNLELMYYDFKKRNGVSAEEIEQKRASLQDILVTKPLQWYIDTLNSIGFENVEVVNSRYMFYTIYARKPF